MNIQIDTTSKKIKIEEDVNLGELFDALESLLPNNAWKDFILAKVEKINNWYNPIIIKEYIPIPYVAPQPYPVYPIYPIYPWYQQPYVVSSNNAIGSGNNAIGLGNQLVGGTFNVVY